MDYSITSLAILGVVSFIAQIIDLSLGMGYGTTLSPILILLGFPPMQVVPALLISELAADGLGAIFHHRAGNVDLSRKSPDLKIALVLGGFSVVGAVGACFIALNIPQIYIKTYIGFIVLFMGVLVFLFRNRTIAFNWRRISLLGLIASFNKGMSGGGYGPVMTSGQILSGIDSKHSIGITTLAESISCVAAVIIYASNIRFSHLKLAIPVSIGAILAVPIAVRIVKRIIKRNLILAISILTICLGLLTLSKIFLF